MTFKYAVSLDDPTQSAEDAALIADTQAAAAAWSSELDGLGTLNILVSVETAGVTRAEGGPTVSVPQLTVNGVTVDTFGSDEELLTGTDPNGAAPDIQISIDAGYLRDVMFLDPNPSRPSAIPNNRVDGIGVLTHEIGHGLGITGFRDPTTGAVGGVESVWDQLVKINGDGSASFTGADAEQVYGGPVPVTTLKNGEQYFHLGNTAADADASDLMNGIAYFEGHHYAISTLDVAIMDDLGLRVSPVPVFGSTATDFSSVGGQVAGLYDAILARDPDPVGFEDQVHAVQAGLSLTGLADAMLNSPEYTARFGADRSESAAAYVTRLYQTALKRTPDASGLQNYEQELGQGVSRAAVATEIGLSGEHQTDLGSKLADGLFVPDQTDAEIARLYHGFFDRAPDRFGIASWEQAAAAGTSIDAIGQSFFGSSEYQGSHQGQSAAQIIAGFYQGALGRTPDAGGLQTYVTAAAQGTSLAAIGTTIAESPEARQYLAGAIEIGHTLA